jgi:filamentous hemagglutinin family protein
MNKRHRSPMPLRVKAVTLAVASCFAVSVQTPAFANPTGFAVVNGQVTFNYNGNTLNVTNTPGSIINWQRFSIGTNELTRFIQQSASSSVLNRVIGVDPSLILGALQSNGRSDHHTHRRAGLSDCAQRAKQWHHHKPAGRSDSGGGPQRGACGRRHPQSAG